MEPGQKCFGGRGSALDPTGGAHDAPTDLLTSYSRADGSGAKGPCPQTMNKKN